MAEQISKSRTIAFKDRSQVIIHRDLYALLAIEAIKRRLKVKDLLTHFVMKGLADLGVDVSAFQGEDEQPAQAKEVA